jgi:xylitol oxidase
VADVQAIVRGANKLRVLGTRHCTSAIADSNDTIISTLGMNKVRSAE